MGLVTMRTIGALAVSVALGLSLGGRAASAASTVVVSTLVDASANDGTCSLREAIQAANTDTTSGPAAGECPAGAGTDTISFSVSGTITLTSALPSISSDVTVSAGGLITVDGADSFRPFTVSSGTAILAGLSVVGGRTTLSGGGIANFGTLTVTGSTISGNTAGSGGGIANFGTLTVTGSTISGNAASSGGGIENGSIGEVTPPGDLTVTNTTISGNSAISGGGIITLGPLTVTNATISGNSASSSGGGLYNINITNLSMRNAIVAGNTAPTSPDVLNPPADPTASLIGLPAGTLLADVLDPAGLQDNGGQTWTIALALTATNPAIDHGDNGICAAEPVNGVDQRGRERAVSCDIGAYEAQPPSIATVPDRSATATSASGVAVTYVNPEATDEQGGTAVVVCSPISGSVFPIGTTIVTCVATDTATHTATSHFFVRVAAFTPTAPIPTAPIATSPIATAPIPTPPPTASSANIARSAPASLLSALVGGALLSLGIVVAAAQRRPGSR
jgi:CSLREA domain-containing protein